MELLVDALEDMVIQVPGLREGEGGESGDNRQGWVVLAAILAIQYAKWAEMVGEGGELPIQSP